MSTSSRTATASKRRRNDPSFGHLPALRRPVAADARRRGRHRECYAPSISPADALDPVRGRLPRRRSTPAWRKNSVDAVVTDPPYHLTSNAVAWDTMPLNRGKPLITKKSVGFMGKAWDGGDVAFRPETWAAVMRVLRPGGHMLACGGTRDHPDQLVHAIRQSGFEVRDCVLWVYGSGFNKVGYIRDSEGQIVKEGWAGSIKPAVELICLARKPLSEGTIAANVLRWGTGALNIDGCRVGFGSDQDAESARPGGRATGKPFSNLAGDADDRAPFVASDGKRQGRLARRALIHRRQTPRCSRRSRRLIRCKRAITTCNRHDSKGLKPFSFSMVGDKGRPPETTLAVLRRGFQAGRAGPPIASGTRRKRMPERSPGATEASRPSSPYGSSSST